MSYQNAEKLTQSQQNYLKAIYIIVNENKVARVKDISNYLGIGAPSVSEGLKPLAEKKLVNYVPYGLITLTDKGERIASELIKNNHIVENFLLNILMVEDNKASENAKNIIHNLSEDVLARFVRFLEFTQICPCKEPRWMKGFQAYIKSGDISERCLVCMNYCKEKGLTKPISTGNSEKCCGMD